MGIMFSQVEVLEESLVQSAPPEPSDPIERAWHTLRWQREGIPWEAIRLLRVQPATPRLVQRLADGIAHAYDDTFVDEADGYFYATPLWYAIVAQVHLDLILIDPVISLFTTTEDDWDFLNEAGEWLLGALAKRYPEQVIPKVQAAIDRLIAEKSSIPYIFLFEAFKAVDITPYKNWLLNTLRQESEWRFFLAGEMVHWKMVEAVPILREILKSEPRQVEGNWSDHIEYEEALKQLEGGRDDHPDFSRPICEQHGDWERRYRVFEDRFYDDADEREADLELDEQLLNPYRDVGRNDPCPCGSGKKFKRCHLVDQLL